MHFNVTAHPTERWTAQQIVEAFPYESAPGYLIRDRDAIYSEWFRRRVKGMGIEEVIITRRSPWQNPYCERLIGSVRRECLDHLIILNERHLRRTLRSYFDYYHDSRTHLSLSRNAPNPREVEPASQGKVLAIPQVGGFLVSRFPGALEQEIQGLRHERGAVPVSGAEGIACCHERALTSVGASRSALPSYETISD